MTWMMDGTEKQREKCVPGQQDWFKQKHSWNSLKQLRAEFSWSIVPRKRTVKSCLKGCSSMVKVLHCQNKPFGLHLVGCGVSLKSLSGEMTRLKECFMTNLSAGWMINWQKERLEVGWIIKIKKLCNRRNRTRWQNTERMVLPGVGDWGKKGNQRHFEERVDQSPDW